MSTTEAFLVLQETPVTGKTPPLRIAAAMQAASLSSQTVNAYLQCETHALALELIDSPGTYRIVRTTCKSRWCLRCSQRRAHTIRDNLEPIIADRTIRMITLTIKHNDAPLPEQLDRLIRAFRKLRSLVNWRDRVRGGVYFLELTRNQDTQTWHPHLHLLCEGKYYDVYDLSRDWLRSSGDSHVVHITLVRDKRAIEAYVTKYLTKPLNSTLYADEHALADAMSALHGRRTVGAFGSWTRYKLLSPNDRPPVRLVGWLAELRLRAYNGDQLAAHLVAVYDDMPDDTMSIDTTIPPIVIGRLDALDVPSTCGP